MTSFMHPHSKNHPLAPIHLFTKQIVPTIINLKLVDIHGTSFPHMLYKLLPFIKNIFKPTSFFLLSFLSHTFLWACRSPEVFYLSIHLVVQYLSHFLMNFSQTYVCTSPMYALATCHSYYFQPKEYT